MSGKLLPLLERMTEAAKEFNAKATISFVNERYEFLFFRKPDYFSRSFATAKEIEEFGIDDLWNAHVEPIVQAFREFDAIDGVYVPNRERKFELETFIGHVCVNTTGRLGIVTHVDISGDSFRAAGMGLDGKGVWTSTDPHSLGTGQEFYRKLNERFGGAMTWHDRTPSPDVELV